MNTAPNRILRVTKWFPRSIPIRSPERIQQYLLLLTTTPISSPRRSWAEMKYDHAFFFSTSTAADTTSGNDDGDERDNAQQPDGQRQQQSPPPPDTPAARCTNLRRIIKPFLLKCHPDITPTSLAKKINLTAIQNLNAYLEHVRARILALDNNKTAMIPQNRADSSVLEIEFMLALDIITGKKKKEKLEDHTSRRRVELLYPPNSVRPTVSELYSYSRRELLKLLKVAGLEPPKDFLDAEATFSNNEDEGSYVLYSGRERTFTNIRPKTPYEISRDRFVRNIQWKNYDRLYEKAVADMKNDIMTEGLIQKYPGRRRAVIAQILSRVKLQAQVDMATQLVTFRRLSLLLDEHFFAFELEDHGNLWESKCRILLCPPRRNNSASALHRRQEGGFVFTVHPNMTLTIHIPVDFRDEEFYKEIDNNVWHFYELMEDDGMAELFPSIA